MGAFAPDKNWFCPMNKLPTSVVTDAHGYTRADVPWILREYCSHCGKLAHYLSGGGMKTFGRTIGQEMAKRRHRRFMTFAGVMAALWVFFYFI